MAKKQVAEEKEAKAEPAAGRSCFVITPIGKAMSPTRRLADGVFDAVVLPVLRELGFDKIDVAHRIDEAGSINQQIIERLANADLVIADLTDTNPNVMYELAIRHCVAKAVVIIAKEGGTLPFDVSHERMVEYQNDIKGGLELREELKRKVVGAMAATEVDNPVVSALKTHEILKQVAKGGVVVDVGEIVKAIEGMMTSQSTTRRRVSPIPDSHVPVVLYENLIATYDASKGNKTVSEELLLKDAASRVGVELIWSPEGKALFVGELSEEKRTALLEDLRRIASRFVGRKVETWDA